jgi:hypothetical protein
MIPPCTCYGVTLTHDQLFALRHFVAVKDGAMATSHVWLTGPPIGMSHDEYEHMKAMLWKQGSGTRVDACPVHPDTKQYDIAMLNLRVTQEIVLAEKLERALLPEHPLVRQAWQRVSWAEERIARCEAMPETQRLIAQRGACEAAEKAGDAERVERLGREWH